MKESLAIFMTLAFTAVIVSALVWGKLGALMSDIVNAVVTLGGG